MPLETADYINGLNAANPTGTDQIAEGDNHIRLIKQAIRNTFPNISGEVTLSHSDLNGISTTYAPLASPAFTGTPTVAVNPGNDDNSQAIATTSWVKTNGLPSGCIVMWSGAVDAVPTGFALCDGTNGTPNLIDRFVVGAGNTYAVDSTGGYTDATLVSHSHTATANSTSTSEVSDPGHRHTYVNGNSYTGQPTSSTGGSGGNSPTTFNGATALTGISVSTETSTTVSLNTVGESAANKNLPPYYALAYIMKL